MAFTIGGETEYYQPKDPLTPECSWCDGSAMVDVGSVIDVGGKRHRLNPNEELHIYPTEIQCPRCREHPGVEPVAPREDR
jgi:hypothetical protein